MRCYLHLLAQMVPEARVARSPEDMLISEVTPCGHLGSTSGTPLLCPCVSHIISTPEMLEDPAAQAVLTPEMRRDLEDIFLEDLDHRGHWVARYWGNGEPRLDPNPMARVDVQPPGPMPKAMASWLPEMAMASAGVPDLTSPCVPEKLDSMRLRMWLAAPQRHSITFPSETNPLGAGAATSRHRRNSTPPPPSRRLLRLAAGWDGGR